MELINGNLIDSGLSDIVWLKKYQKLQQQLSQLQQEKEELIKHCENEIYNQKESIELLSNKKYADIHIGAINAYKNVLSKLKESDK